VYAAKTLLTAAISSIVALTALSTTAAENDYALEEIIVTAQKRAESAQDVPIAISAISQEFIQNVGAQDMSDLGAYIPGLETRVFEPTQPAYNIRGIVTNDFGIGADPAVAVYIDGVYSGRSASALTAFQDLERVEVLKGPQGTLFGKNAAAGAIHMITKKPTEQFEANVNITAGNYNKQKIEAMVNLPLADNLFLRFNVMDNERDGYRENTFNGKDVSDENNGGARAALLWDVSDTTEVLLRVEYVNVDQSAVPAYGLLTGDDLYGDVDNDGLKKETLELWGGSLTIESDLGPAVLTSITASKIFETKSQLDQDGTSDFSLFFAGQNEESNNFFSQEFRLTSNTDSNLRWTLGAMHSREHAKQSSGAIFSTDLVDSAARAGGDFSDGLAYWNANVGIDPNTSTPVTYTAATAPAGFFWDMLAQPDPALWGLTGGTGQSLLGLEFPEGNNAENKSTSTAIYADATYSFTDQLDLTMGVRYTEDEKTFKLGVTANSFGFPVVYNLIDPAVTRTESWENVSYRAVLDYAFSDDAMVFLSYATGYKAGGFNSTQLVDPFDDEEVTNIELGIKSTWMDGRLRLNGSVFSYEYEGLQEVGLLEDPSSGFSQLAVRSIDSEAQGAELDITWLASENLMFNAIYSYVDSEVTDFPLFEGEAEVLNREGKPLSSVAKNTYAIGAEYTLPLDSLGELSFRVDYSYTGPRDNEAQGDDAPYVTAIVARHEKEITDGYTDVSAKITFRDYEDHWRVALYATNLTDEEYLIHLGGQSSTAGSPSAARNVPRMYGVEVGYTF